MSEVETVWNIYRDERELSLLRKVRSCLEDFKKKFGLTPNVVGVPSSLPKDDETALRTEGVEVVRNVPAWATSEIWIGRREEVSDGA